MSQVSSDDILFFFGAGASAPFGIPTMKQFVSDFEEYLSEHANESERKMYANIKETLEKRLNEKVDLEGVFTVIDGVINYQPGKLGLLPLYFATEISPPTDYDITICRNLKEKFQNFVRERCVIPSESFDKIRDVFHDFFNRMFHELGGSSQQSGHFFWNPNWAIFTTNYDLCLEYYFREVVESGIDTGFTHQKTRNVNVLNSRNFLERGIGIQLLKLHGSISWLIDKKSKRVIEVSERGLSYMGRKYEGEMMIYPIAEKELYFDPYISILLRLNRELDIKPVWVVIGYSFNDPVVREIFLRKSTNRKRLILVHPKADAIYKERLKGMKGETILMEKYFGLSEDDLSGEVKKEEFRKVNHQIVHKLKKDPRYSWEKTPPY